MAAWDHSYGSLLHATIVNIGSHRTGSIIRVWPKTNVLVPLYLLTTVSPLKIYLRMVKFNIRTNQIRNNIRYDRLRGIFPIRGVMIIRTRKAPETRVFLRMTGLQIPSLIRLRNFTTFVNHLSCCCTKGSNPGVRNHPFQK